MIWPLLTWRRWRWRTWRLSCLTGMNPARAAQRSRNMSQWWRNSCQNMPQKLMKRDKKQSCNNISMILRPIYYIYSSHSLTSNLFILLILSCFMCMLVTLFCFGYRGEVLLCSTFAMIYLVLNQVWKGPVCDV